jgi:hypothetical protein
VKAQTFLLFCGLALAGRQVKPDPAREEPDRLKALAFAPKGLDIKAQGRGAHPENAGLDGRDPERVA